jgi:hypothetical protein
MGLKNKGVSMLKFILNILFDECGGLGITRASLVSAVADSTGDDSSDAVVKIRRLINEKGPEYCMLAPWLFNKTTASFSFTAGTASYSGASYFPDTFKKYLYGYFLDGTTKYPVREMSLEEYNSRIAEPSWQGKPDRVLIHKISSGYWEAIFYPTPDQAYSFTAEIEQHWTDLTSDSSETIITKDHFSAFSHFIKMARFIQQGDTENYQIAKAEWWNEGKPQSSILGTILANLSRRTSMRKGMRPSKGSISPFGGDHSQDYGMSVR